MNFLSENLNMIANLRHEQKEIMLSRIRLTFYLRRILFIKRSAIN